MEIWLTRNTLDCSAELASFIVMWTDREQQSSKKKRCLAILVNLKWCHPGRVTLKESIYTPDIELLAVGLRPHYLPWEFSHTIVVTYIALSVMAACTCDIIHSTVTGLQTLHLSAMSWRSSRDLYCGNIGPSEWLPQPSAVRIPGPNQHKWHLLLYIFLTPGEAWKHSDSHVLEFSSAFHPIRPLLLAEKLSDM